MMRITPDNYRRYNRKMRSGGRKALRLGYGMRLGQSMPIQTAIDTYAAESIVRPEFLGKSENAMKSWLRAQVSKLPTAERDGAIQALTIAQGLTPDAVTVFDRPRGQGTAYEMPDTGGQMQMTPLQRPDNRIWAAFIPAKFKAVFAAQVTRIDDPNPKWHTTQYQGPRWVLFDTLRQRDDRGREIYYTFARVQDTRTPADLDAQADRISAAGAQGALATMTAEQIAAQAAGFDNVADWRAWQADQDLARARREAEEDAETKRIADLGDLRSQLEQQQLMQEYQGGSDDTVYYVGGGVAALLIIGLGIVLARSK